MKTLVAILVLSLSGCSALPSLKYCDKVNYTRDGTHATLHAECTLPAGGML